MLPGTLIEFRDFPTVTQDQLRAYAKASGDFNPIHLDPAVAAKVGLPGVIAHGMLIAAYLAERAQQVVRDHAEFGSFKMTQFQTRFKAMTLLGDTPNVGGTIKDANGETLVLELQAKNQRGEVTTLAAVKFQKIVSVV